jgi:hypothetical protein
MASTRVRADRDAAPLLQLVPAEPEEPADAAMSRLVRHTQLTHISLARSRAILNAAYACQDAAYERLSRWPTPHCVTCMASDR